LFFLNNKLKRLYFSRGKVGSSTFCSTLTSKEANPDNWQDWEDLSGTGVDFSFYRNRPEVLRDYEITVIIRNPWSRYISGLKEDIIGPHRYGFDFTAGTFNNGDPAVKWQEDAKDAVWEKATFWEGSLRQMFATQEPYHNLPEMFSAGFNSYHLSNFLYNVPILSVVRPDVKVMLSSDITNYIEQTYNVTVARNFNVSTPGMTKAITDAIDAIHVRRIIEKYLEPEIRLFDSLQDPLHRQRVFDKPMTCLSNYSDLADRFMIEKSKSELLNWIAVNTENLRIN